jgi:ferrous iron transport protein B
MLAGWTRQVLPQGALNSLIADGVIAGVGAVLVFLPQILLLFLFILLLEDSGYMARAAFLMDRVMGRVGLHGRAFIPLLSSHACAIPGIMATRTIENRRDRLTTILVAPLTTCSARLPVYSLIIAAFIPNTAVLGPLRLQGLVMFGLYAAGIVSALGMAMVFRATLLRGPKPPLLLEMPTYKWPAARSVLVGLIERAQLFVRRAGTVILSLSIVLWFLASYPKAPADAKDPAIDYSYAGHLGHWLEPVMRPIGFDWRISVALIPGFAAREVMVGALATVYAVEDQGEAGTTAALGETLKQNWSLATALSLLVWYILACQCLSTLAVTRRETNSWRWPAFMLAYMTTLAYGASFLTYHTAVALGGGGHT